MPRRDGGPRRRLRRRRGADRACWPSRRSAAIKAEWKTPPQLSEQDLFEDLKSKPAAAAEAVGRPRRASDRKARSRRAWPRPTTSSQATYTIAYIAHAPLEPRAAVAEWNDGKLTVWTGTQRPFGVRGELASAFGMPPEQRARDRARHRLRLRRQAHRRSGHRSGAAGQGGRQAGQARLDARGGIHLGLLPPGRRDRSQRRRAATTARSPPGSFTTTTRAARPFARCTTSPTSGSQFHPSRLAAAARLVSRAGGHGQPLRPRDATWTTWPTPSAWTRSNSA